jgi:hypothetical protein
MQLSISQKMELVRAMLNGSDMLPLLHNCTSLELLHVHRFVWEKTLEFGIKTKGRSFPQEELQTELRSLSQAQLSLGCPGGYKDCQIRNCYSTHPECMRTLAIQQIEVMFASVQEFFKT